MANPVKQLQRKSEEYQKLDKADRRRFWSDGILNNALYILMIIFIVYTAIKNKNSCPRVPSRTSFPLWRRRCPWRWASRAVSS